MNTTLSLNPAFCLLLLRQREATWSELVRIIFMDLVQRKKLSITPEASAPGYLQPIPLIVSLGDDGRDGKSQLHERFLLEFFYEQPDARLPLKSFLKLARKKIPWAARIHYLIENQPAFEPYFQSTWWQRLFGRFSLSTAGFNLKATIATEISAANTMILQKLATDPAQAATWVKSLGAHALLLPDLAQDRISATLNQLQDALTQEEREAFGAEGFDMDGFDLELAFVSTISDHVHDAGDHGHGHDSGCGTDSGDGGDSGGGDSGCGDSGCSGCGGGCGGGD